MMIGLHALSLRHNIHGCGELLCAIMRLHITTSCRVICRSYCILMDLFVECTIRHFGPALKPSFLPVPSTSTGSASSLHFACSRNTTRITRKGIEFKCDVALQISFLGAYHHHSALCRGMTHIEYQRCLLMYSDYCIIVSRESTAKNDIATPSYNCSHQHCKSTLVLYAVCTATHSFHEILVNAANECIDVDSRNLHYMWLIENKIDFIPVIQDTDFLCSL